jgi:glyoxylase-like metal-dependent hydrolase (beta-lactamase superfamily II)
MRWHGRIGGAIAGLWALLGACPALAQPQSLEPGVEWLPGRFVAGQQPDGNSVLIDAPDGWIVVDSGRTQAHVQALLERLRASGKPLRAIVNTHWHLDHIGGNRALRSAYPQARVIASEAIIAARSGFLADYRKQLLDEMARRPVDDAQRVAWQREGRRDRRRSGVDTRPGDRRTLDPGAGRARAEHRRRAPGRHRGGDVWVYEPSSQVLAAGDLVTLPAPLFDTACPERWRDALARISTIRFRWLVPGHGEPLGRGQFLIYRESFERLLACAASPAPKQQCIDGWVTDAAGLFARAQQPLARSLLSHYIDQTLRAPRAAACQQ